MTTNTVILKASDGEEFMVQELVAMEMTTVKLFLEDRGFNSSSDPSSATTPMTMPLFNVSSRILSLVINYLKGYFEAKVEPNSTNEATKTYGEKFLADRGLKEDAGTLIEMCVAAHYLDIKHLLELITQAIADHIENKEVEYVRELFGIENDFSPGEEESIRKHHEWAHRAVNDKKDH